MDKYTNRLIREWEEHGKIIVAVDFDDTLNPWGFTTEDDSQEFKDTFKLLKEVKHTGAYIVVFTACKEDRYDEIRVICENQGLIIDTINEAPIKLPYGNNRKVYANVFLDDRAGLTQAKEMLETAMYHVRAKIKH